MHRYARVSVHEFSGFEFSILNLTSIPFSSLVPSTLRPALRGFEFSILNLASIFFSSLLPSTPRQHSAHHTLRAAPRVAHPAYSTPRAAPLYNSRACSTSRAAPRVQHPMQSTPRTAPRVQPQHLANCTLRVAPRVQYPAHTLRAAPCGQHAMKSTPRTAHRVQHQRFRGQHHEPDFDPLFEFVTEHPASTPRTALRAHPACSTPRTTPRVQHPARAVGGPLCGPCASPSPVWPVCSPQHLCGHCPRPSSACVPSVQPPAAPVRPLRKTQQRLCGPCAAPCVALVQPAAVSV